MLGAVPTIFTGSFLMLIMCWIFLMAALGGFFASAAHIEASHVGKTWIQALGSLATENIWRTIAICVLPLNLKALPVMWHMRIFHAFVQHFNSDPQRLAPDRDTMTVFQPLITRSHTPLLEIDYNLHKSNTTYYSDLDVSRTHLLLALFQPGLASIRTAEDGPGAGRVAIVLGAVHCSFRREIQPYQPYEMWSRILCWDRKWLYVVTHFVQPGAVQPSAYTLQPWRQRKSGSSRSGLLPLMAHKPKKRDGDDSDVKEPSAPNTTRKSDPTTTMHTVHPAVFATAISKYVLKKGRLTIPPERLIAGSGLLPLRAEADQNPLAEPPLTVAAVEVAPTAGVRDWATVEQERQRGLRFAQHFAQLDGLHEEFAAESGPVLGKYGDLLP